MHARTQRTSVAWDDRIKVLDVVGPLDSRCQETPERRHRGCKDGKRNSVHLNRLQDHRVLQQAAGAGRQPIWNHNVAFHKDFWDLTGRHWVELRRQVSGGARHPRELREVA